MIWGKAQIQRTHAECCWMVHWYSILSYCRAKRDDIHRITGNIWKNHTTWDMIYVPWVICSWWQNCSMIANISEEMLYGLNPPWKTWGFIKCRDYPGCFVFNGGELARKKNVLTSNPEWNELLHTLMMPFPLQVPISIQISYSLKQWAKLTRLHDQSAISSSPK